VQSKDVLFRVPTKLLNVGTVALPLPKLVPRLKKALGRHHLVEYSRRNRHRRRTMQQLDIPIITKTYELYRALHDLKKGIPKMERYSLWSRVEATALQMLEGFVHAGYLPCEQRAQKLTRLAAEVDMLRMFIRLAVDIKVLPLKKVVPLQERLDEIGRMLGGWIKSVRQR
jgi:hypothetical protein